MGEWTNFSIDSLASFHNAKRVPLSKMQREARKGAYPYYGASGIIDTVDDFLFDGEFLLISEDGENLKTRNTPIAFIARGKFWVNNHAHIVQGKKPHLNMLLSYYFQNLDLNEFLTGAVQPKLNKENLQRIPIFLPKSESEQKAITEILTSVDDKIDLLHRQNKTLETLGEALFRHWIIDAAQDDWEPTTIGEIVTIKGGTTPSTKTPAFWDGDICWTSPRDLSNQTSVFLFDTARKITPAGLAEIGSGLMPVGTVLMSSRAPIGYLTIADIPVAINQGYIAMVCDKSVSSHFAYLWCKANMEAIKNAGNGSTFEEISKGNFKSLECLLPPTPVLSEFEIHAEALFRKIHDNSIQVLELEKIRNTLLPKLISGEVRVEYEAAA